MGYRLPRKLPGLGTTIITLVLNLHQVASKSKYYGVEGCVEQKHLFPGQEDFWESENHLL